VKVSLEILGTNIPVVKSQLEYSIKTWWTQITVRHSDSIGKTIELATPPLFIEKSDQHQKLHRKTPVFLEVWYENPELFTEGRKKFLGIAKANINEDLGTPTLTSILKVLTYGELNYV